MNNCLVTVLDTEDGLYREWQGCRYPVRGIQTRHEKLSEDDTDQKIRRTVTMWACNEADVEAVVAKVSQEWVGYEIKIFNLAGAATRIAGEIKNKLLTKDGMLPA